MRSRLVRRSSASGAVVLGPRTLPEMFGRRCALPRAMLLLLLQSRADAAPCQNAMRSPSMDRSLGRCLSVFYSCWDCHLRVRLAGGSSVHLRPHGSCGSVHHFRAAGRACEFGDIRRDALGFNDFTSARTGAVVCAVDPRLTGELVTRRGASAPPPTCTPAISTNVYLFCASEGLGRLAVRPRVALTI
jgi:hypothetical protein